MIESGDKKISEFFRDFDSVLLLIQVAKEFGD